MMMRRVAAQDVASVYRAQLSKRGFVSDPAQWRAVERLQRLYEEWSVYKARRRSALRRMLVRPPLPRGVYLWGGVGRGKSFLMDAFFLCVPLARKRRVHFHHFMREIHRELDELKGTEDPIAALAERTARRNRLICFDEFHVGDIADAMILGRFLEQVMERGVVLCMTSNYAPHALYPNGLQRERFLPAIALLEARLDVLEVDSGVDYRRRKMERLRAYHVGPAATRRWSRSSTRSRTWRRSDIRSTSRDARSRTASAPAAWSGSTSRRCAAGRARTRITWTWPSASTRVILSGVPRMSARNADAARRFTWLLDVFYDDGVKLFASAEAQPEELFVEGANSAEFARSVSRLHEMQSAEYLRAERARR